MERKYLVYTDGGCSRNPGGPGAAASIVIDDYGEIHEIVSSYKATTNNRMELIAVIQALEIIPDGTNVVLYSDSQYVLLCMSGLWEKKKNRDLWRQLEKREKRLNIRTVWVKGHDGNLFNEQCDELCTEAMKHPEQTDSGYRDKKPQGNRIEESEACGAMGVDIIIRKEYVRKLYICKKAETFAEEQHIKEECARSIMKFFSKKKHVFKDYRDLQTGGIDHWSRKSADYILKEDPQAEVISDIVMQNLVEEKEQVKALRWYARGLDIGDAIRKVLVDREISNNAMRRALQK